VQDQDGQNNNMPKRLRIRNRWEDNMRMDLKEIGISVRSWINLAQDRETSPGINKQQH
jgi:hypothetical protein